MNTPPSYRTGAMGALLDEYERAVDELKVVLQNISDADFVNIVDVQTADEDCRSVQTIMRHTVRAGYGYAGYLQRQFNLPLPSRRQQTFCFKTRLKPLPRSIN